MIKMHVISPSITNSNTQSIKSHLCEFILEFLSFISFVFNFSKFLVKNLTELNPFF